MLFVCQALCQFPVQMLKEVGFLHLGIFCALLLVGFSSFMHLITGYKSQLKARKETASDSAHDVCLCGIYESRYNDKICQRSGYLKEAILERNHIVFAIEKHFQVIFLSQKQNKILPAGRHKINGMQNKSCNLA